MSYISKFEELKKVLSDTPGIRLESFDRGNGLKDEDITMIEMSFDVKIDEHIKSFYREINGLYIRWEVDDKIISSEDISPDFPVIGEINIVELETVFMGYNDSYWENYLWFDHMEKDQAERLQQIKPFDFFDNNNSQCICFNEADGYLKQDKLSFYTGREILGTNINLEAYLKEALHTKGIQFWQEAFLIGDKPLAAKLNRILKLLFGEYIT